MKGGGQLRGAVVPFVFLVVVLLLQPSVIQVMQIGLDVVGVTVDIGKEELRNRGFAALQFLSQSMDQRQAVLVLLFEFFPPLASTSGGLFPAQMIAFDLLQIVAKLFIAPTASVLASGRQICG